MSLGEIQGWKQVPCSGEACGSRPYVREDHLEGEPAFCNVCEHERKKKMGKKNGHAKYPDPKAGSEYAKLVADGGSPRPPEYVDELPVPIDRDEVEKAATEFTRLYRQREATLEERREAMAGFKKTLDGIDEQMKPLAETVEKHTRLADIRCIDVLMPDNSIHVVRLDTHERTGEVKTATADDLQEKLEVDGAAAPADA